MLKLDAHDIAILSVLAREGRLPKTALAQRVGLSATPCSDRLRRLEDHGVIEGYRAEVSLRRVAPHVTVFVTAELASHRAEAFAAFERAVAAEPEITAAWAVGGGFDYLLQIVTRDVESYQRLMDGLLERRVGLARYFTYIVTKAVKSAPPPLGDLLGARGN